MLTPTLTSSLTTLLLLRLLAAAVRLAIACSRRASDVDVVILLGGCERRERAALAAAAGRRRLRGLDAAAAAALATAPVYVSSPAADVCRMAASMDAALAARVRLDETAVDTLTNFSTLVPLIAPAARRALVLTSRAHARRARALAWIILGTNGVAPTVVAVPTRAPEPPESAARAARDVLRAAAWVATGVTGAVAGRLVHGERFRHEARRAGRLERPGR